MANRQFAYSGAIPLDTDLLSTNKDAYIGLAKLSAAILGLSNTFVNNATCSPTGPASLNVVVSACEIYAVEEIDPTAYGDLGTDTHNILKQGINLDPTTLSITPPGTGGYSQNYLIEFGFNETDGGSTVLTYYNASNPAQPWSGPNNTGAANNTVRQDQVSIQAKAGVAAPTGTQTTPAPDSGYIGGFVVTVANGQTQITSGNITAYLATNPNFINETLTQKISQTTADARYAQQTQIQTGQFIYCVDTGSVNALAANLTPAIASYTAGMGIRINVAHTNTGATTISLNGVTAANATREDGSALLAGDIRAGMIAIFQYDGTNFQLQNQSINLRTPVSASATLAASVYKTLVVVTGSSAQSYTLPAQTGNAGNYIDFTIQTTSNATVTLTPASGTIDGQSNIVLGTGDSLRLETNGTNWTILNLKLQPCNGRVYLGSLQTLTNNVAAKIDFNTVNYDIGSSFDVSTNYRATPLWPGKYSVNFGCTLQNLSATGGMTCSVLKNGSAISLQSVSITAGLNATGNQVSDLVYMNGITDYLEGWANMTMSTTFVNVLNGSPDTYFVIKRESLF